MFDGAEANFGRAAEGNASGGSGDARDGGSRNTEKAPVSEGGQIQTESSEIVGEKSGAANFGVDGVAESVGESQTKSERGEFVDVRDEAPASRKERLDFQLLLVASLRVENAGGIGKTAIDDAVIVIPEGSVLPGFGAKVATLGRAATAEVLSAEGSVHPRQWRPVKSVAEDEAFAIAIAWLGNEESGLTDLGAGGRGSVGEPDERNAEQAEVGADQGDVFVEADAGVRRIELPRGTPRIANGDPRAAV